MENSLRRSGYSRGSSRLSDSWKAAGAYLQELREKAGLTQKQVTAVLGWTSHQQLSSVERGNNRLPPEHNATLAILYQVTPAELTCNLLRHYSPYEYECLFGEVSSPGTSTSP